MKETAISTLTRQGHEVRVSDLKAMHFNPVSGRHNFTSVRDRWVDRVFAMRKIHGNGRFYNDGVFRGKRAMLANTTR